MLIVRSHVKGVAETMAALRQAETILRAELNPAMREALFLISRTAQVHYLSGPRPQKLGVVTNRLRGSLAEQAAEGIFRIEERGAIITGTVGTAVVYGPTHEYGLTVRTKYATIRMPKRAFMAPALADSTPAIRARFQGAVQVAEQRLQTLLR